ncbi:hypothetical protein N7468_003246 [Penicillium chermesinum]|uniref:Uncharacterized protein n=1 Tax=Penicillium chermesinum TaxID=63820 RepID=A0A9W9TRM7_9EURO|nr:uncharacterized protein N7468_003246 [Penicillium chermesinum]KAJ5238627.1 hypothetical protein N7468_003246 [Penicillium chermesinum]
MSPIELPSFKGGQSHDYPNTTKGNPIQGRRIPPSPLQPQPAAPLCPVRLSGAAIELLLWRRVSALPDLKTLENQSAGCPGTFSQSKSRKEETSFVRKL